MGEDGDEQPGSFHRGETGERDADLQMSIPSFIVRFR
jgi:hypothetical protein